jgi:hypothetical protein
MTQAKPKAHTLDIFAVLDAINAKAYDAFSTMSEEEQKALQPFVLMKWMLGTDNKRTQLRLNARANPYMFALGQHKELLFKLLCAVADGKSQRYSWMKMATKGPSASMTLSVIKEFYGYSERHAKDALPLLSKDEVLEMAQYLGRETEELTKIKNEFKARDKAGL